MTFKHLICGNLTNHRKAVHQFKIEILPALMCLGFQGLTSDLKPHSLIFNTKIHAKLIDIKVYEPLVMQYFQKRSHKSLLSS